MLRISTSVPLVALVLCLGCRPGGDAPPIRADAAAAAVQRLLAIQDSVANAQDLQGFMQLIAEDAVFLPPGDPPLTGKSAIREWYEGLFQTFELQIRHFPGAVEVMGPVVIHRGSARGTLIPRAGGEPIPFDNKYLFVLQARPDGSLEHWRVMFNANPPPPSSS